MYLMSAMENIELHYFHSDNSKYGTEWNGVRRGDDYHRLYFVAEGEAEVKYDENLQVLRAGHSYLFPKTRRFEYRCPKYFRLLNICFLMQLPGSIDVLDVQPYKVEIKQQDPESFARTMAAMGENLHSQQFATQVSLRGQTLSLIAPHFNAQMPASILRRRIAIERLKPALDYIRANITTPIHVGNLCSLVNMSRSHFAKVFTETFGVSAQDYIRQLRIEQVKVMLRNQADPIANIADDFGYSSASHLTHEFKIHTGYSPKDYRNMKQFYG